MEVRVRGRGVQITERVRSYAVAKVIRSARFFDRLGDVNVSVIKLDHPEGRQRFRAEMATRRARHGVRAEGEGDTVEHAIDAAADRLGSRLRRLRDRLTERRAQRPWSRDRGHGQDRAPLLTVERGDGMPEIVRMRRPAGKPMTPEDATLVMNEHGHAFLVFTNAETDRFSVLYRRSDGKLGLIEPE